MILNSYGPSRPPYYCNELRLFSALLLFWFQWYLLQWTTIILCLVSVLIPMISTAMNYNYSLPCFCSDSSDIYCNELQLFFALLQFWFQWYLLQWTTIIICLVSVVTLMIYRTSFHVWYVPVSTSLWVIPHQMVQTFWHLDMTNLRIW